MHKSHISVLSGKAHLGFPGVYLYIIQVLLVPFLIYTYSHSVGSVLPVQGEQRTAVKWLSSRLWRGENI